MMHAAASQTPAAWSVSLSTSRGLAGGSGDPGEPHPEGLARGLAVLVEALKV